MSLLVKIKLFSLLFWKLHSLNIEFYSDRFLFFFFFPSNLKHMLHCLLASIISERFAVFLIFVPLYVKHQFSQRLWRFFSLSTFLTDFISFIHGFTWCCFFHFPVLGICWTSYTCWFIVFIKFEKNMAI